MRLDKSICDAGHGSRKEIQFAIKKGRVTINDATIVRPETITDPKTHTICLDGKNIDWQEFYYILLNKPQGYVSSTDDPKSPTVLSLLPKRYQNMGLFPAGRLDKDATGLLLLTNDGELAHKMLAPKSHVDKKYYVEIDTDGYLDENMVRMFEEGVMLVDNSKCLPAKLEILTKQSCFITLNEGKFHQIKRMLAVYSCVVVNIHRISFGSLILDDTLSFGNWRQITKRELGNE